MSSKILVGVVVSTVVLVAVLMFSDASAVVAAMAGAQWEPFIWLTLLIALQFVVRAIRFRRLICREKTVSIVTIFDSLMLGNFINFLLPLRAGEFARPIMLSQVSQVPFATGFAAVIIERLLDLVAVLLIFAVIINQIEAVPSWLIVGAMMLTVLALTLFVLIIMAIYWQEQLIRVASILTTILPAKIGATLKLFFEQLIVGAAVLGEGRRFILVVIDTIIVWGLSIVSCYISVWLIGAKIDVVAAAAVLVFIALAVAAPSAPGFIGLYQVGCVAGYGVGGISYDNAVALSLMTHAHQYVLFVAYGTYILASYGLRGLLRNTLLLRK